MYNRAVSHLAASEKSAGEANANAEADAADAEAADAAGRPAPDGEQTRQGKALAAVAAAAPAGRTIVSSSLEFMTTEWGDEHAVKTMQHALKKLGSEKATLNECCDAARSELAALNDAMAAVKAVQLQEAAAAAAGGAPEAAGAIQAMETDAVAAVDGGAAAPMQTS